MIRTPHIGDKVKYTFGLIGTIEHLSGEHIEIYNPRRWDSCDHITIPSRSVAVRDISNMGGLNIVGIRELEAI